MQALRQDKGQTISGSQSKEDAWELVQQLKGIDTVIGLVPAIIKRRAEVKNEHTRRKDSVGSLTDGLDEGWSSFDGDRGS